VILEQVYNKSMKGWKLILAIWSPVIILGLIYLVLYSTHYLHAKHLHDKAQASFTACQDTATSGGGGEIGFVPHCQYAGEIAHGFLGLPYFVPGDYN
jgi:hypothetical protein